MDDEEEIGEDFGEDYGEDYKVVPGDFNQKLHNELIDHENRLHNALDANNFQKTFQELFRLIQPVGCRLIQDIPDKSRLDIPIDVAMGLAI